VVKKGPIRRGGGEGGKNKDSGPIKPTQKRVIEKKKENPQIGGYGRGSEAPANLPAGGLFPTANVRGVGDHSKRERDLLKSVFDKRRDH